MVINQSTVVPDPNARRSLLTWEETGCLLCGRDESHLLTEAADHAAIPGPQLRFAVVQCGNCGLVYTNPRPTAETIGCFYPVDYRPHAPRPKRVTRLPSRFLSAVLGRPCAERRGRLPWPGTGRLLDFGCGGGSYLRRMADLGWRVAGLDVSSQVVQSIRNGLGFEAHLGTLPHADLAPESFEVITMWQSLEHVHQPLAVLRAAYELLVPGGKVVVAVPNFESRGSKWFGEYWFGLDLPRHLTHFTRNTLHEMLGVAGFRVQSIRGLVHYHWLQASATRTLEAREHGLLARLLRCKSLARAVAWGSYAIGHADSLVAVAERPI